MPPYIFFSKYKRNFKYTRRKKNKKKYLKLHKIQKKFAKKNMKNYNNKKMSKNYKKNIINKFFSNTKMTKLLITTLFYNTLPYEFRHASWYGV